ncbi:MULTISPECIES: ribosome maturation factor RimP [unclassified Oceanobacter]|uniref:ribosome maturation factor RimP n=1 Tax=unclassified Oceanobacter TaxID=2620260 RepID=UPI0026E3C2D9|nr:MULTISPECIES: ribosome maturation factor RimP [unclassified Oceanobacter]MDO6681355.1 ribosome maturation factor RimP [Oceanobacter sp. 5_MG-2023]MDP2505064.1 ribosome maturation factor RimP [Oceanobacter sp. 3_MG-2023]MDP2548188.1 ribosome maturation factor RimP [Oceanobacter sp. 4_MG-2023]MDP2608109.1 ribosome maturation factor RimP [Oceanobacter sp. 1_MG-2023]MDP2611229.1 ribosome maturation factor RimP [Oceanobacter sp. 2_MG-2023]
MLARDARLLEMLAPVVESMGFVFWGLELVAQGRHTLLRVYIDHADGITVDHCADVSRQIGSVLDVEDPISQDYTLEVSSPGMDRPLFTMDQYVQSVGEEIELRLRMPFDGRRKFKGRLQGIEEQDIVLLVDNHEYLLPVELIEKAHIVPNFDN